MNAGNDSDKAMISRPLLCRGNSSSVDSANDNINKEADSDSDSDSDSDNDDDDDDNDDNDNEDDNYYEHNSSQQ